MFNRSHSIPSTSEQPNTQAPSKKRFGKKLYAVIGAIVAISIIAAALLIPQGAATIPLEVNYIVGEKMVYNTNLAMTYQLSNTTISSSLAGNLLNNTKLNFTSTIEVIGFDGEYYTLNNTQALTITNKASSYSYLQKMNKTGYSTFVFNFGSQQVSTNISTAISNPYLTELLNRSEVKVGDTWQVPFPNSVGNNSSIGISGSIIMTFKGFEDLTVPAGTYRVFRVDMTSQDLAMHLKSPQSISTFNTDTVAMNINGQMYMEYGTLRQIKSTMQESVVVQSAMMNYTTGLSMEMTLVQHIKPAA
jgi:hypothetical protein